MIISTKLTTTKIHWRGHNLQIRRWTDSDGKAFRWQAVIDDGQIIQAPSVEELADKLKEFIDKLGGIKNA